MANTPSPHTALKEFITKGWLAGAVTLVADKTNILHHEAIGYFDLSNKKPMQRNSTFWIASQTKPITATLLMMLVDEKKLKLDDPVSDYLPIFNDLWLTVEKDDNHTLLKRPHRPITIRDILSHTAGMEFASAIETPTFDRSPLDINIQSYAKTPLKTEPGTQYSYSNMGTNTAGRIIEVVGGLPYENFLDQRLLQPLGMTDTTFWPAGDQLDRLAKTYKPSEDKTRLEESKIAQLAYPLDNLARKPMPAGGLFSTATDIAKFCQMVFRGGEFNGTRYLSNESVHEMTRLQTGDLSEKYGLCLRIRDDGFGHDGALATNMIISPKHDLITILLVQHQGFIADANQSQEIFHSAAIKHFRPSQVA